MKPLRSTAPETSLLNPRFRYVPSHLTDVRKTFDRIRWVQRLAAEYPETDPHTWNLLHEATYEPKR